MNINNIRALNGAEAADPLVPSQPLSRNTPASDKAVAESNIVELREEKNADIEKAKEITEALNEMMDDLGTNLGFSIREDMDNQVIVEVKNRSTNELIRQIPSEEMLKIMEKMEALAGVIFDGTV